MNNDHQHLEKEWNRQCEKWCRDKDFVTSQFTDLVSRYSAKSRHYHSLKHIRSMLTLAKSHRAAIQNWDSVYFAIWFHDAIQGLWVDGESASAELCEAFLVRLNVPVNLVALTKDMILATKHHVAQHNSDIGLFLDLDIAILGSNREDYQEYTRQTRREYPIPSLMYNRGRAKFIETQLAKKALFNTCWFQEQFEEAAQHNLREELARLR